MKWAMGEGAADKVAIQQVSGGENRGEPCRGTRRAGNTKGNTKGQPLIIDIHARNIVANCSAG